MKQFFTLSTLFLAVSAAIYAQAPNSANQLRSQTTKMLLNRQTQPGAQKTTSMQQRLIALQHLRHYPNNQAMIDSVHYYYTGYDRGSAFDFNNLYYDLASGDYPLFLHTAVKADSSLLYTNIGALVPAVYSRRLFTYTPGGNISSFSGYIDAPAGYDVAKRSLYTYNAQGLLTQLLNVYDTIIPPTWKFYTRNFYLLNAQGNLTLDSMEWYNDTLQAWRPATRTVYVYDATGIDPVSIRQEWDAGGGNFILQTLLSQSFYPDHRLRTLTMSTPVSGTGFMPLVTDSFGYTGNNSFYTARYEYNYNGSTVGQLSDIELRHLNAQNLPDTNTLLYWNGGWTPGWQQVFVYNSFGNPDHAETYDINSNGTFTPNNAYTYYYETYNPTAVSNVPATTQDIQLYPNPAGNILSVRWNNATANTPVSISITAMNGQAVYTETLRWGQAIQQLPIGHLQPGMYSISIAGQDGRVVYNGKFVKE